ncbi:MAG: hypothetical protein JZU47_04415 [Prolixibacteraceae bacterium]|nr:hypothetical protein [Prolixibacteraceae bacterium]
MKKLTFILLIILSIAGSRLNAQDYKNFISCKVDGKEWKAEAKRMQIPINGFEYLALAAFQVNPDVQVWITLYYFTDSLKPGTYPIISEQDIESKARKNADKQLVWVLVDYTEETKGLGHAFHDGESLSGNLIITNVTKTSIEGSFEANLTGVYYKKRAVATMTGSGLKGNLRDKLLTSAGGGMLTKGGAHDHDNSKKTDETDSIVLSGGKFLVDWTKTEK